MTETTDKTIGGNLARLRGDRTQAELARQLAARGLKWSQATVWKVETGERPLRLLEAVAVARVLGVDLAELVGEAEDEDLRTLRAALAEVERQHEKLLSAAYGVEKARGALQAIPREVLERLHPLDRALTESAFWTPVQVLQRQGEE